MIYFSQGLCYDDFDKFQFLGELIMGNLKHIVNNTNTQLLCTGGGKFDSDKTVLTFEYYIRFLNSLGCADISIVHSKNGGVNTQYLSQDAIRIIGNRVYSHEEYKNIHQEIKTDIVARSRVCMGFKFNDCFHMLETDTLIGTKWFNELRGENTHSEEDVTHSIGNLGLVPYKSGYKGRKKDYPQYKFSACDEETIKELNSIMFYGDCNSGIYSINDNSTKEKVYDAIAEREAYIIRQIPELESFFKCNNS